MKTSKQLLAMFRNRKEPVAMWIGPENNCRAAAELLLASGALSLIAPNTYALATCAHLWNLK